MKRQNESSNKVDNTRDCYVQAEASAMMATAGAHLQELVRELRECMEMGSAWRDELDLYHWSNLPQDVLQQELVRLEQENLRLQAELVGERSLNMASQTAPRTPVQDTVPAATWRLLPVPRGVQQDDGSGGFIGN